MALRRLASIWLMVVAAMRLSHWLCTPFCEACERTRPSKKRRLDRNRIARKELTLALDVPFYGGHPGSISCETGSLETRHRQQASSNLPAHHMTFILPIWSQWPG
jgi:hypothetical protein